MKRGFTFWEVVIVLAILVILASIMYPLINRSPNNSGRVSCQSKLKQVGLALQQYTQDYEGKYPDISYSTNGTFGWAYAIQLYIKSTVIFQCPSEKQNTNAPAPTTLTPRNVGYTDYWMNARLAGVEMKRIKSPAIVIINGDGNDGTDATDARYAIDSIPQMWIGNSKSPLYRHLDGANYGYVDGHVKWLAVTKIKSLTQIAEFTFAPR
jgi:prepilin-type N-terminal cleavage/methylation domain-containing protein/prepilin-type processing-associated H-X9-DG protein